jgi:signal transduction histidine kinase
MLRNAITKRGFRTPSCLWAYRQVRGGVEELYGDCFAPDMAFMQILLLKETDPSQSVPFLVEHFLSRSEAPEELRMASQLCILRLLDSGVAPEVVRSLQTRYPGVEILHRWRPGIPGGRPAVSSAARSSSTDFHHLVRSVHDMEELSSLTRTAYILSLFHVPLTLKEWRSLCLSRTDELFFQRLQLAGMVESANGGFMMASDAKKQAVIKKFLYEAYPLAKESVRRNRAQRLKEEREKKVRSSELDRQALEMVPDGIVCVEPNGMLYYMNRAADAMLNENKMLRERLFGEAPLEEALRGYSPASVRSRITAGIEHDGYRTEIFGDRVAITNHLKRFEVELGPQVMLLRDTTDQYLIDNEIGKLYRHELKAALDVMGVGLDTVRELLGRGSTEEALEFLEQVEQKRVELSSMLEERIDFIRLHSDAFHIKPEKVNLNLVVDKCINNYRKSAAAKGIGIQSDHLRTDGLIVRGEERFLARALDNIVRNAVKFCDSGARIRVSVRREVLDAVVQVQDTGPGIPPENLGKVFRLGFTTGGSGRGLYLARRIIVAHGGRIELTSHPGEGTSFAIHLPLLTES